MTPNEEKATILLKCVSKYLLDANGNARSSYTHVEFNKALGVILAIRDFLNAFKMHFRAVFIQVGGLKTFLTFLEVIFMQENL